VVVVPYAQKDETMSDPVDESAYRGKLVYLSHPLTTHPTKTVAECRESAAKLAADLQKMFGSERAVYNPCALSVPGWDHDDYMRLYAHLFASGAVALVVFSPDWEQSVGCRMERFGALACGLPCRLIETVGTGLFLAEM
jgi:hypothetical protein